MPGPSCYSFARTARPAVGLQHIVLHTRNKNGREAGGCSWTGDRRYVGRLSEGQQRSSFHRHLLRDHRSLGLRRALPAPRVEAFGVAGPLLSLGIVVTRELDLATTPSGVP